MMVKLIYHKICKKLLDFVKKDYYFLINNHKSSYHRTYKRLPTSFLVPTNLFFGPKLTLLYYCFNEVFCSCLYESFLSISMLFACNKRTKLSIRKINKELVRKPRTEERLSAELFLCYHKISLPCKSIFLSVCNIYFTIIVFL